MGETPSIEVGEHTKRVTPHFMNKQEVALVHQPLVMTVRLPHICVDISRILKKGVHCNQFRKSDPVVEERLPI
jgi:hypothetical protein